MSRWSPLLLGTLLAVLLGSALLLVHSAYDTRRLFTAIERARAEQDRLDREYLRLDAERQAQATHLRVEAVARERLHMRTATAAVTQVVVEPKAAPAEAAVASALGYGALR